MTYAYDDAGNQISRTDGNGNTTQFRLRRPQAPYQDDLS